MFHLPNYLLSESVSQHSVYLPAPENGSTGATEAVETSWDVVLSYERNQELGDDGTVARAHLRGEHLNQHCEWEGRSDAAFPCGLCRPVVFYACCTSSITVTARSHQAVGSNCRHDTTGNLVRKSVSSQVTPSSSVLTPWDTHRAFSLPSHWAESLWGHCFTLYVSAPRNVNAVFLRWGFYVYFLCGWKKKNNWQKQQLEGGKVPFGSEYRNWKEGHSSCGVFLCHSHFTFF